jgi:hypothetical protein
MYVARNDSIPFRSHRDIDRAQRYCMIVGEIVG